MSKKLEDQQIVAALRRVPEWVLTEGEIRRVFKFTGFPAAIAFVNQVAELAERHDHHPDIDIRYDEVRLALVTHSDGGITDKDFALAREIEGLLS